METKNKTNKKETTRGFVKIDRRCFNYIDRTQPLTKFEALADLIQLTVNTTSLVVKTHGVRVNIPMGCVLLSERTCMKRWRWASNLPVRKFLLELRTSGILAPVQVISKAGTIYAVGENVGKIVVSTCESTYESTKPSGSHCVSRSVTAETKAHTEPLYLLDQDNIIYKKENPSFFPKITSPEDAQYHRFETWAQQCLPPHARPADRAMFFDMLREAGSPNVMADALIYMEAHDIPISEYSTTLNQKPWADEHR